MEDSVQPVLCCGEGFASDLTVFLAGGGTSYEVYLGVALLERVGADPAVVGRKMLVGRLHNAGVSLRELSRRFGHDPRTIKKWAGALRSGDIEVLAQAFAGRGSGRKTSPELIAYVRQLYRHRGQFGHNYREQIIDWVWEVFGVRLSTTTVSGIFGLEQEASGVGVGEEEPEDSQAFVTGASGEGAMAAEVAGEGAMAAEVAGEAALAAGPGEAPGSGAGEGERIPSPASRGWAEGSGAGAGAVATEMTDAAAADAGAQEMAIGVQQDGPPASNLGTSVKQSPTPPPVLEGAGGPPGGQWLHHAGQVLFAAGMAGFADAFQRQLLGQLLQGAVNIEQSKTLCLRSLSQFTGPVVTGLREQRQELDAQASQETIMAVYRRNAALLVDGPGCGTMFYFDPHTKEYTGQLKLLKGWCGRRHGITKALNLDSFHTRSGRPCFVCHYSPYYDLRERFFMSLAQFDELFAPEQRCARTFVIDRGIYGLATLRRFGADHVITWEKGYQGGGWVEGRRTLTFTRDRYRNHSQDRLPITFHCQQEKWRREPTFRRLIVRVERPESNPIQVAILTSHPDMDCQDVVWAIFCRWLQENDFKYLDTHFGLNQLTSRASLSFEQQAGTFQDRPVDSPEYRELKKELQERETKLARLLLRQRRCAQQADHLQRQASALAPALRRQAAKLEADARQIEQGQKPRSAARLEHRTRELQANSRQLKQKIKANRQKADKLHTQIAQLEAEIAPIDARLCDAVRQCSRLRLLIDGHFRLLDTRRKAWLDALRITAANLFRNVQSQYRGICDNFRDDHVLVRMLSRCQGRTRRRHGAVEVRLWLPGTLQPHRTRHLTELLKAIEKQTNRALPQAPPLRLSLTAGPQRC
jgi:hypothetical protein